MTGNKVLIYQEDPAVVEQMDETAERLGMSRSALIRTAVRSVLSVNEETTPQRRLTCTHCGNTNPHTYMRLRSPDGWQAYCRCDNCGARNWLNDQDEPWACIRYTDINEPSKEVSA